MDTLFIGFDELGCCASFTIQLDCTSFVNLRVAIIVKTLSFWTKILSTTTQWTKFPPFKPCCKHDNKVVYNYYIS